MTTLPKTMRAVVLTGHGGLDRLEVRTDYPTPAPGPGDVIVKVAACGLNNTDINTRTAWYSKTVTDGLTPDGGTEGFDTAEADTGSWSNAAITFPRIQGADVTGTIAAVGQDVDKSRIGERVIVDPWLLDDGNWQDPGRSHYFGSESDGGFADYTRVRATNALAINTPLTDAELATFPCAYTTAENLIAKTGLKGGETVVISGASGGVGSAAIQLCKLRGANIIAIASASKAVALLELGATTVVDRNESNLGSAVQDAAGGQIDVALDVVGGTTFTSLINNLRHAGRYSSCGTISGPMVDFDLRQLVYKDLQLTGATICPPGTMAKIVGLIESGALKPLLAETFPMAELGKAQEVFMAKRHVGNFVVVT